jgi:hypothetical protein
MRGKFEDQLSLDLPQMCRAMAVTTIGHQQSLGLHVIPQHQLPGIRIKANLLVHPLGHQQVSIVAIPSCLKRQNQVGDELTLTTRIRIQQA